MKSYRRNIFLFSIAIMLLSTSGLWAQSASRGSGSRAVPMTQLQPSVAYPPQSNTFIQQGTVVQQPGSATRGPSTFVPSNTTTMGSGSRNMVMPSAPATFEQKLWNYLVRAKYRNWAPVPGKSDGMYEGQSPHGAFLKMYLNRKAAGSLAELPSGAMVIKENYGPDQKTLMAITVMYKNRGYNPAAGDWYWVKYNPDGSVANKTMDTGVKRLAGKVMGCINCHGDADGDDFVFYND